MSDQDSSGARPPASTEIAQATPKKGDVRSYDEMNTGTMMFELQGTVGEIKQAISDLSRTVERGLTRIENVERVSGEIKDALRLLVPKLEDLAGFTRHRAPTLADKADLANLKTEAMQGIANLRSDFKAEIERRPTRRQAVFDIAWVVGLIAAAVTLGARAVH